MRKLLNKLAEILAELIIKKLEEVIDKDLNNDGKIGNHDT